MGFMDGFRQLDPFEIEKAGTFILVFFISLIVVLERFFPYQKGIKIFRKGFWMDLLWYTLIQSYILKLIIFDLVILPLKEFMGFSESGMISHWPIWLLIIFFLVSHDLYIYWFHRWQHSNKWLWKTHEAHHSVRDVDWLAGSRSHPAEILINQTIEFAPIFFLLDAKTAAIVVPIKALIDAIWGIWIHSNLNFRLGKLIYLINGPEMHHWHHANHREVYYANFATKFSVFDWIFKTAFLPGKNPLKWKVNKPLLAGLPYKFPETYPGQLFYIFGKKNLENLYSLKFLSVFRNIFRQMLDSALINKMISKWSELFSDQNNPKYLIENDPAKCIRCGSTMRFFYEQDQLKTQCLKCGSLG